MCGRFTIITRAIELIQRFGLPADIPSFEPRYNLAPGQPAPIIIEQGSRRLEMMTWGLIPYWAKDTKGQKPINARSESLFSRPMFRDALASRRCLVPSDGFYEWTQAAQGRGKVPFRFVRKDRKLFAMAGLWDKWTNPDTQESLFTFTLITTPPNPLVSAYHDRMPAILTRENESLWLASRSISHDQLRSILLPYPTDDLEAYQVTNLVNYSDKDTVECISPVPGE